MSGCYVFSILQYDVEAWTLTESSCKKLEAFEMWEYTRMLRLPWRDKIRNIPVLSRINKPEVVYLVKKRKLEYLVDIMTKPKIRPTTPLHTEQDPRKTKRWAKKNILV
ncbi:jg15473 [Pararge aegeria aegeria]|uniref:Jg15473 protein n=1 Tax=Pararge aegeria aegeria TaxID=348720 RepID=A0A8S4S2S0_9NEOP|nr:jg15473 [Pararge aegeria aegeria]